MHPLVMKQLKQLKLQQTTPPSQADWQAFLTLIDKAYVEAEHHQHTIDNDFILSKEEMNKLNEKLLMSARQAGMAEIATYVLHNVGNVLNSANISVTCLRESIKNSKIDNIICAINLLHEHLPTLADYLTNDPKGKLLPDYLIKATYKFIKEQQTFEEEIKNLTVHIQHIKNIVTTQELFSGKSDLIEEIQLKEILNTAIRMCEVSLSKNNIQLKNLVKDYLVVTDKNKLMQIILNLLQNAKDALAATAMAEQRIITINTEKEKDNYIILMADNGIGIAPEHLEKMFTFGFTTKKNGHGFGLHSSALLAKELGGHLTVESRGLNQGATFILTLPSLIAANRRSDLD